MSSVVAAALVASGLTSIVAMTVLPATTAQAADGPAWTCSTYGYLFQSPGAAGPTSIYQVDLVSGESSVSATASGNVNAVGYNPTDNYVYGFDGATSSIVQVASDGTLTQLPAPAGVNTSVSYNVGEFDNQGHYWLAQSGTLAWYEIDYAAGSATYGQVLSSGTFSGAVAPGPDWVYVDGSLYSLNASGELVRFDTATHAETNLGQLSGVPAGTYGAGYADAAGNLYYSNNTTGLIYRIDPATQQAITLSNGPSSSGNDGARCASAPIPTVTVTKTVVGRAAADDQFVVGLDNAAGATLTEATTAGGATTASTTNWPVSLGDTYTITDAMAGGSTDTLDAYQAAVVCTDSAGNTFTTGGTKGAWTFTVPGQVAYTCNVTNTADQPGISVVKHAGTPVDVNGNGVTDEGDTIAYTFTVTNTGNTTLTDVGVTDAKAGAVTCPESTLAAGADETCEADSVYTVTAADVDNGSVDNTATANGTPPGRPSIPSTPSTTNTPTTAAAPALTVVKTASTSSVTKAGQDITYSFKVTNTGNVPLNDVTVTDSDFSGTGELSDVSCPSTTLAVGEDEICTATYTTTQADVDAGGNLSNTASGEGTPPGGDPTPSDPSTIEVPVEQTPGLSLVKTAEPADQSSYKVGETITYSFAMTNTGNTTLTDVHPEEGDFSGTGTLTDPVCPAAAETMAPGAAVTCTATYTLTQADVDSGKITNTATGIGTPPGGGDPIPSTPSTVTVPNEAQPALVLVKTSDTTKITTVGQAVTYSFKITNTGNVTQKNVHPAEGAFNGSGTLPEPTCPAAAATLAPGDSVTCTTVYHVTKADLSTGTLTNTATATGTGPNGDPYGSTPSTAKITAIAPAVPAIPGLAFTGFDGFWPLTISAVLLLLGAMLWVGAALIRRRNGLSAGEPTAGINDLF
jgi:uncharacterized repeat protein (TIGR01451 family)